MNKNRSPPILRSDYIERNAVFTRFEVGEAWVALSPIEQSIKRKIEAAGKPLREWDVQIYRGVLTGCNEAFIIDGAKKEELIKKDPKSAEIIRPILRGRDIKRYGYEFADKWLINAHNGVKEKNIPPIDIKKYPAIKAHLDRFYPQLAKRQDKGDTPYNLRNCAYMEDFNKQKIVWGEISDTSKFCNVPSGIYLEATTFMMTGDNLLYILATLNSKLAEYYFNFIGTTTGVGTNRWKKYKIENLYIKYPAKDNIKDINMLLKNNIQNPDKNILSKINSLIYDMYDIDDSERRIIQGS